jgi:YVTN family beta-propeller protein
MAVIDPRTNRIVADVPIGADATRPAIGAGVVWVASVKDQTVVGIDPKTRKIVRTVGLGFPPSDIAAAADAVWVADGIHGTVSRIDPRTNLIARSIQVFQRRPNPGGGAVPHYPSAIAAGTASVWANAGTTRVVRVTPGFGSSQLELDIGADALAFGLGALWVLDRDSAQVARVPESGRGVSTISLSALGSNPPVALDLAVGPSDVWIEAARAVAHGSAAEDAVDGTRAATVYRVDPKVGGVIATVTVGRPTAPGISLGTITADDDGVWAINGGDGTVSRIDPKTNRVVRTIPLGATPTGIVAGAGYVWVTVV